MPLHECVYRGYEIKIDADYKEQKHDLTILDGDDIVKEAKGITIILPRVILDQAMEWVDKKEAARLKAAQAVLDS